MDSPLEVVPVDESSNILDKYPRPRDIKVHQTYGLGVKFGVLGKQNINVSAGLLVRFMQISNRWTSFSHEALVIFCRRQGISHYALYGLFGPYMELGYCLAGIDKSELVTPPPYVICLESGNLCVTELFIKTCTSSDMGEPTTRANASACTS